MEDFIVTEYNEKLAQLEQQQISSDTFAGVATDSLEVEPGNPQVEQVQQLVPVNPSLNPEQGSTFSSNFSGMTIGGGGGGGSYG
tara:strand:- start:846 stop:1097 length:252 start_codon:yes stop_codon:yes gene_type:complete